MLMVNTVVELSKLTFSHISFCCLSVKESLAEQQSANMKKKGTLENLLVMVCTQDIPFPLHPSTQHPLCDGWHEEDTMKRYTVYLILFLHVCLLLRIPSCSKLI